MSKFYIFSNGGKQYKIAEGQNVWIDLNKKAEIGQKLECDLLFDSDKGILVGKKIELFVINHKNAAKLIIQKHKRRKAHEKSIGFRQRYTIVNLKGEK